MNEPTRGMTVWGPDGQFGIVDDVVYDNTGDAARILVRRTSGQTMILQPGTYRIENGVAHLVGETRFATERQASDTFSQTRNDDIYRTQQLGEVGSVQTLDVADNQSVVIPVVREELRVSRREVERGGVRVHKRVEEREEVVEQPTYREEVTVERVTLGQPLDQEVGSRQEGDTLIIPVLEEVIVTEKRLMLVEEIHVTRRQVSEEVPIQDSVRREYIEIERPSETSRAAPTVAPDDAGNIGELPLT